MWLDVVKDYDCEILYHPGKTNVVANVLSRKVIGVPIYNLYFRMTVFAPMFEQIHKAQLETMK